MDTQNTNPQLSNEHKRQKRGTDKSPIVSDDDCDGSYPAFIVVEATDGQSIKLSVFGIQKLLKCAV